MRFYVECSNQKRIINILLGNVDVIHAFGRSSIFRQIENLKEAVVLVDGDPGAAQPLYLSQVKLLKEKSGLKLFTDKRKNRIILIYPNLEEWIYRIATKEKVSLENYGFSKDLPSFIHEAKVSPTKFQLIIHFLRKNKNKELEILERFVKGNN
jgi:hypothetical protein